MTVQPPKVAIIGRVNVGKSTLFNRLIEKQKSLVSKIPGTTRDRFEADCLWRGRVIRLIDTGGMDINPAAKVDAETIEQARLAIKEAAAIIFVVDLTSGLQDDDRQLAKELMKSNKPVILAGNKADTVKLRSLAGEKEWYKWNLGTPLPISASRGSGTGDLLDRVFEALDEVNNPAVEIQELMAIRVAVLGKPNVGKSTLLNSLVGHHRFITSEKEHTTREPNDTVIHVDGKTYLLIDTAGMRKTAKMKAGKSELEIAGVHRSLQAVKRAHVILFVIDVTKSIQTQDKHLAGEIAEGKASVIIIANKWDQIPDKDSKTINKFEDYIRGNLPQLDYAPIVFTSAITGKRVQGLFNLIDEVYQNRFTELDHRETYQFISKAIKKHLPSKGTGPAYPKITSFHQIDVNPPTFRLGLKQRYKTALNETYLRYLENQLRDQYGFDGTPIRVIVGAGERKRSITGQEYEKYD